MASPFDIRKSPRLGEEVHFARLENGLTLGVLRKPGFLKKHAILATRYGSTDNVFRAPGEAVASEVPPGIAHFLEHKLFEEEGGNAFDRFSRNGAYCNAFTSYTTTAYLFSCTDLFDENLKLLVDFVGHPYFTDAAIEREKSIIAQEIRMYEDSPDWRGFQALLEALYVRHPVRIDITGTVESIGRIDKAALERSYRAFYRPENMILFATGDLEPEAVRAAAEAAFSARPYAADGGAVERIAADEPATVAQGERRERLDVSQPRLLIGWKDPAPAAVRATGGLSGRELMKRDVELSCAVELIFGRSGELYQRLYEAGVVDTSFAASYTAERDHGYIAAGGETDAPDRLRDELVKAAARAVAEGFDEADVRRIKNKAIGKFLRNFNSLEFIAGSFVQGHFLEVDFFEYLPMIDAVTADAVRARAAEVLVPGRMACSIIEPQAAGATGAPKAAPGLAP